MSAEPSFRRDPGVGRPRFMAPARVDLNEAAESVGAILQELAARRAELDRMRAQLDGLHYDNMLIERRLVEVLETIRRAGAQRR